MLRPFVQLKLLQHVCLVLLTTGTLTSPPVSAALTRLTFTTYICTFHKAASKDYFRVRPLAVTFTFYMFGSQPLLSYGVTNNERNCRVSLNFWTADSNMKKTKKAGVQSPVITDGTETPAPQEPLCKRKRKIQLRFFPLKI